MKIIKFLLIALLIVVFAGIVGAVEIDNCTAMSSYTSYTLNKSISLNGSNCLTLGTGTVLNCKGYTITGNDSTNKWGITTGGNNGTVKNCVLSNWNNGGIYTAHEDGNFINITINDGDFKLYTGASNNTIKNLVVVDDTLYIYGKANDTYISNLTGNLRSSDEYTRHIELTNWSLKGSTDLNYLYANDSIIKNCQIFNHTNNFPISGNNITFNNCEFNNNSRLFYVSGWGKNINIINNDFINLKSGTYNDVLRFWATENLKLYNNNFDNVEYPSIINVSSFNVSYNTYINQERSIQIEESYNGVIYSNKIIGESYTTGNHGLLINEQSHDNIIYNNNISFVSFGLLFEWGSYSNIAYNNNIMARIGLYDLHNTWNNTAYNNNIDGSAHSQSNCIKALDNVTDGYYYNNVLSGCYIDTYISNKTYNMRSDNIVLATSWVYVEYSPNNISINETSTQWHEITLNNTGQTFLNYNGRKDFRIEDNHITINILPTLNSVFNSSSATPVKNATSYSETVPAGERIIVIGQANADDPYITSIATTITAYKMTYSEGQSAQITCTGTGNHNITNLDDLGATYYAVYHNGAFLEYSNTDTYEMAGCSDWEFRYTQVTNSEIGAVADTFVLGLSIFGAFAGILAITIIGMFIIKLFKEGLHPGDMKKLLMAVGVLVTLGVIVLMGIAIVQQYGYVL